MNPILGAYWRESLADNQPLRDRVGEYVTDEVIDAIAVAHRNGQRLLIGTTNLDAQRPVIWNMGAVANSKHSEAYAMFRKVLVASAAIPVLFPPTFIDLKLRERSTMKCTSMVVPWGKCFSLGSLSTGEPRFKK